MRQPQEGIHVVSGPRRCDEFEYDNEDLSGDSVAERVVGWSGVARVWPFLRCWSLAFATKIKVNTLARLPNGVKCILPQSGTYFDSLAECNIHRDFCGFQQARGIGAESIVTKGAIHLPSLRFGRGNAGDEEGSRRKNRLF